MFSPSVSGSGLDYVVAVEGLSSLFEDFDSVSDKIKERAAMAINATARKFRTASSRAMRETVAFPARYLDSSTDGKLRVRRMAQAHDLEAAIEGQFDPTSLARFVVGAKTVGRKAPNLRVSPGQATAIPNSFIMKLRSQNVGLAIRLKAGETIKNKHKMVSFSKKDTNLYLLYGPSVDQVFRQVAGDVAPDAAEYLEKEFLRLTEAFL